MASDAPSVLRKIVAHKREEVAAAKAVRPRIDVDGLPPTRGFAAAIRRSQAFRRSGVQAEFTGMDRMDRIGTEQTGTDRHRDPVHPGNPVHPVNAEAGPERLTPVRLIAEVKHASPVKGVLRADFDPVALARAYHENGAAAISVLTDERFFQGHPDYLGQIRETVPIPLLRKEFIIDEWQVPERRALRAD